MFDCPFDLQDITTAPNTDRLADLERRKKEQDVMNLPMRTGINEEVTNQRIDNAEEHGDASSDSDDENSDSSSDDIYGNA
ncbi:hypothetical protein E4U39_000036 [Claviceps sp. Clav50 group G5]|nr:hypothetical protein E4U39_000036 [Claviceps sp. Clav50 group G5]